MDENFADLERITSRLASGSLAITFLLVPLQGEPSGDRSTARIAKRRARSSRSMHAVHHHVRSCTTPRWASSRQTPPLKKHAGGRREKNRSSNGRSKRAPSRRKPAENTA